MIGYGGNGVLTNMWDQVYEQLVELVQGLENVLVEKESNINNLPLSLNFVTAMKQGARQGMRNK